MACAATAHTVPPSLLRSGALARLCSGALARLRSFPRNEGALVAASSLSYSASAMGSCATSVAAAGLLAINGKLLTAGLLDTLSSAWQKRT